MAETLCWSKQKRNFLNFILFHMNMSVYVTSDWTQCLHNEVHLLLSIYVSMYLPTYLPIYLFIYHLYLSRERVSLSHQVTVLLSAFPQRWNYRCERHTWLPKCHSWLFCFSKLSICLRSNSISFTFKIYPRPELFSTSIDTLLYVAVLLSTN